MQKSKIKIKKLRVANSGGKVARDANLKNGKDRVSGRTIEMRVHRIVGQVEALERMVEEGRPCLEITQQIAAARSALGSLAAEILKERGLCGGGAKQTAELERIVDAVMKYS